MKSKPRSVRLREVTPRVLAVEPHWVGREPNYRPLVDYLIRTHAEWMESIRKAGGRVEVEVFHDDGCEALSGGCCGCDVEVRLVEYPPA